MKNEIAEIDRAKAIAAQMIKHGGGFSKMLGAKLAQTNIDEIEEFKKSWPSYWKRFGEMAEVD